MGLGRPDAGEFGFETLASIERLGCRGGSFESCRVTQHMVIVVHGCRRWVSRFIVSALRRRRGGATPLHDMTFIQQRRHLHEIRGELELHASLIFRCGHAEIEPSHHRGGGPDCATRWQAEKAHLVIAVRAFFVRNLSEGLRLLVAAIRSGIGVMLLCLIEDELVVITIVTIIVAVDIAVSVVWTKAAARIVVREIGEGGCVIVVGRVAVKAEIEQTLILALCAMRVHPRARRVVLLLLLAQVGLLAKAVHAAADGLASGDRRCCVAVERLLRCIAVLHRPRVRRCQRWTLAVSTRGKEVLMTAQLLLLFLRH
mmetsp:Transcript_1018/g.2971  ORF Transcript_1018/g.2971 Transcript_1018/m.2971 type:complete len:313 (+) Transcript_1018:705-1643(+)